MSTPFLLPAPSGGTLHGRIDEPTASGPRPTVVICHGFKGFMDWGFFPYLAALLAERGFFAVRFNVSGSGMEPGEDRATDLEGFRRNTFSRELEDLDTVLAALLGENPGSPTSGPPGLPASIRDRVDAGALGLVGHSRGGGTTLLGATRGRFAGRIRALVTWAAVATFDRFDEDTRKLWREQGALPIRNARTGQELHLGLELLEDLEAHPERLDLESAAREIAAPWLILHGSEDESVPIAEAERLYHAGQEAEVPVRYEAIAGTGHTFGAQHPFLGPTPALTHALNATQRWLRRHLDQGRPRPRAGPCRSEKESRTMHRNPPLLFWDVDTQVDFMESDGHLYVPGAESLVAQLQRLTDAAQSRGIPLVASADDHFPDDSELSDNPDLESTYPPHCLHGTEGQKKIAATSRDDLVEIGPDELPEPDLIEALRSAPAVLLLKKRFDVFSNPNTERVLALLHPEHIVLYGVALDVCVAHALEGMWERGYRDLTVVTDACRPLDEEKGEALLREWGDRGVALVTTDELLADLEGPKLESS